jgi:hypothetical protein
VIAVLPKGSFDRPREELERRLHLERLSVPLALTQDDEGGWTSTFAPPHVPAVYLVNGRREMVWQSDERLDAATLTSALDQHLLPVPVLPGRSLKLNVVIGEAAPDVFFRDSGAEFALHRLRGRQAILCFWQAWSEPCLKELRRLQSVAGTSGTAESPFIVAFHGAKDPAMVDRPAGIVRSVQFGISNHKSFAAAADRSRWQAGSGAPQ